MPSTFEEYFVLAIEIIVGGVFIWSMASMMDVTGKLSSSLENQRAISSELESYREYNQFDGNTVYAQDIVSAIFKNRGTPSVWVTSSKGSYSWTGPTVDSGAATEYTTTEISALIDFTAIYNSRVIFGGNGEVVGFEFIAQ